jgi:hypothetical protein
MLRLVLFIEGRKKFPAISLASARGYFVKRTT